MLVELTLTSESGGKLEPVLLLLPFGAALNWTPRETSPSTLALAAQDGDNTYVCVFPAEGASRVVLDCRDVNSAQVLDLQSAMLDLDFSQHSMVRRSAVVECFLGSTRLPDRVIVTLPTGTRPDPQSVAEYVLKNLGGTRWAATSAAIGDHKGRLSLRLQTEKGLPWALGIILLFCFILSYVGHAAGGELAWQAHQKLLILFLSIAALASGVAWHVLALPGNRSDGSFAIAIAVTAIAVEVACHLAWLTLSGRPRASLAGCLLMPDGTPTSGGVEAVSEKSGRSYACRADRRGQFRCWVRGDDSYDLYGTPRSGGALFAVVKGIDVERSGMRADIELRSRPLSAPAPATPAKPAAHIPNSPAGPHSS